MNHMKLTVK